MRTKIIKALCITIVVLCTLNINVYAQWNNALAPDGRTLPTERSIGIGPFTTAYRPLAALHIDTKTPFPASPNFLPGEVFRTDGPSAIDNNWRFNTGTGLLAEKGKLFVLGSSFDFSIQASAGRLLFNANGSVRCVQVQAPGWVGIGDYQAFLPVDNLHIHSAGAGEATRLRFTNNASGNSNSDGFQIGIRGNNPIAVLNQFEQFPMIFNVRDASTLPIADCNRLLLTSGTAVHNNVVDQVTRVSIPEYGFAPITNPGALLHLGEPANQGYRSWMDVGTYMSYNSDNMYVGMLDREPYQTNDRNNAVINWGDDYDLTNPAPFPNSGPDDLVFLFTDFFNPAAIDNGIDGRSDHGAEIARMTFGDFIGRMGINEPTPLARLHITAYDVPVIGAPTNVDHSLQLRLSYRIRPDFGYIAAADFRVLEETGNDPLTSGHLLIIPFFNPVGINPGEVPRNVGIGYGFKPNSTTTFLPRRRLDIHDDGTDITTGLYAYRPQFRISQTLSQTSPEAGIFTDFTTTDHGNLLINPYLNQVPEHVGINLVNTEPGNTLEINSDAPDFDITPNSCGGTGASGLRFTDLRSGSTPCIQNPGIGVLSVDATGNVIYVPGGSGGDADWFDPVTNLPPNIISTDKYTFGRVYINVPLVQIPAFGQVRFGVNQEASVGNQSIAGGFLNNHIHTSGGTEHGIYSVANGPGCYLKTSNYGGYFKAENAMQNFGGYFETTCNSCAPSINYGIYAKTPVATSTHPCPTGWAGYFNGNVVVTGTATVQNSDIRFKDSLQAYTNALEKIRNLNPETYVYKISQFPSINLPQGLQYGLIAQEVETVFPELISEIIHPAEFDTLGNLLYDTIQFKAINYNAFIPITIRAVQELDSTVTVLQQTTPPSKPILFSPVNNETGVSKTDTLVWYKSERTKSYILYVSALSPIQTADTFAIVTIPLSCKTYTWWVTAYNAAGASDNSDLWSFSTDLPGLPDDPILSSPHNGTTGLPLTNTFMWKKTNFADEYIFFISTRTPSGEVIIYQTTTADTFAVASVPSFKTDYRWWIIAQNCKGISHESEHWTFVTTDEKYLTGYPELSDAGFKTNITPLTGALDKILQLNGIYFDWNITQYPDITDSSRQIGFIAQDIKVVIPEVVTQDADSVNYIDYGRMVPVMSEAIKELNGIIQQKDSVISSLDSRLTELEDVVSQCCSQDKILFDNTTHIREVELSDEAAIVLDQNVPNPFAENTSISYFIPDDVISAQIIFTDNNGRIIKMVEISERGKGLLKVFAQDLSSGIYSYTLVADGKTIDTKKMVKSTK